MRKRDEIDAQLTIMMEKTATAIVRKNGYSKSRAQMHALMSKLSDWDKIYGKAIVALAKYADRYATWPDEATREKIAEVIADALTEDE